MHSIVGEALCCKHCMRNSYGNNQQQVTAIKNRQHTLANRCSLSSAVSSALCCCLHSDCNQKWQHTLANRAVKMPEFLEVQVYYI